jgi:hypothetical protein
MQDLLMIAFFFVHSTCGWILHTYSEFSNGILISPLFLTLEEEAAVPTCNLSKTVHNTWFQASGSNMVDLYNATLDDYCRAAMQSNIYHNFLKGRGGGIGPYRMVLKLHSATRSGDPKKIAQAVGELSADVGLYSRVPNLKGESIFGSAKRKLDLPPGYKSDSHCHDRMNFTVPKIGCTMTPAQSRARLTASKAGNVPDLLVAFIKFCLPVHESVCANPMAWQIERLNPSSKVQCSGHIGNRRYTSKIAKYRRATAAPTFTGIKRKPKSKEMVQKQLWFCPTNVNRCVLGQSRWIVHYPNIPCK